jgi:hypothetical protein
MVLVIYTENKIIHVLEASNEGTLKYKAGRMAFQGTIKAYYRGCRFRVATIWSI